MKVEEIHTYYGNSYILQGISIEVGEKEVVSILGRNGMGKTTLMNSLIGFIKPRQGKIFFCGEDISQTEPYKIVRKGLSLVPQGRQIFPSLTVEENLRIASLGIKKAWNLEKVYELFPPLKKRYQNMGNKLSGGEQQMLAVGRSLMTNPSMVLMDEPTEGLSPIFVQTIGRIIRELHDQGIAILLVEQNLRFALKFSDYIHIMSKGRIVYSGLPADLDVNQSVRSQYLGV